ncbi:MAG: PEP-CTERM sorting domain-containing protein [Burkholderiales bacterium]|jgi:hypothetical protein|nr:PEP-CTERM sorting domain-containing protein [Burkholderiales bacterium]
MRISNCLLGAAAGLALGANALAAPILWIGDIDGQLGTVDVATGNAAVIGSMGHVMTDIAFDPLGNLWGTDGSRLYQINATTAASTLVGSIGPRFLNSLVFAGNGALYAAGSSLVTINTATGAGTAVGVGNGFASSGDLAFVNGTLYLSSNAPVADTLWSLDTGTGLGTQIGAIGSGAVYGLATADNSTLYGLSGRTVLSVDTATGAGTTVVSYANGLGEAFGTAFRTEAGAPVPEPSVLSMFAIALAGVGVASRRRKA